MIEFIDNAEDRIVLEVDAEWYERKFCVPMVTISGEELGHVPDGSLLNHIGLGINWSQSKTEYTGDTYMITFTRLWV